MPPSEPAQPRTDPGQTGRAADDPTEEFRPADSGQSPYDHPRDPYSNPPLTYDNMFEDFALFLAHTLGDVPSMAYYLKLAHLWKTGRLCPGESRQLQNLRSKTARLSNVGS